MMNNLIVIQNKSISKSGLYLWLAITIMLGVIVPLFAVAVAAGLVFPIELKILGYHKNLLILYFGPWACGVYVICIWFAKIISKKTIIKFERSLIDISHGEEKIIISYNQIEKIIFCNINDYARIKIQQKEKSFTFYFGLCNLLRRGDFQLIQNPEQLISFLEKKGLHYIGKRKQIYELASLPLKK